MRNKMLEEKLKQDEFDAESLLNQEYETDYLAFDSFESMSINELMHEEKLPRWYLNAVLYEENYEQ